LPETITIAVSILLPLPPPPQQLCTGSSVAGLLLAYITNFCNALDHRQTLASAFAGL
jgi:hypothetical protein